jgi:hypothetical protein
VVLLVFGRLLFRTVTKVLAPFLVLDLSLVFARVDATVVATVK